MMKLVQSEVELRRHFERTVVVRFVVLVALVGRCIPGSMDFGIEIDLEHSKLAERMVLVELEERCILDYLGYCLGPSLCVVVFKRS